MSAALQPEPVPAALTPPPVLAVHGRGVVPASDPIVRTDDEGLVRGDGCFEGCRLIVGDDGSRRVDKLDAHLARFAGSASSLGIPFDAAEWRLLIADAAGAWTGNGGAHEAAVKLVLTRGVDGAPTGFARISALSADYLRQRRDGVRVVTLARGVDSHAFSDAPWLLGGVKTLSYAINMAAYREAESRGADDVIFMASDSVVLEAPTSAVVWSVGRTLYSTVHGDTGILASTTQARLFERAPDAGWQVEYVRGSLADLHAAEGLWLINSVRGVVDIVRLDDTERPRNPQLHAEIRELAGF